MPETKKHSKAVHSNLSAEKLLLLMETMSTLDEPIRLQDLAKRVGMNASTLLRFLAPLQNLGYIDKEQDGTRYYLTFKLCGIANNISSRLNIRNVALPFLRQLANKFRESVNLSIEEDMSVMYVEVVNGPNQMLMTLQRIGHVAPMHCTGVGKILLLEYNRQKIDRMIAVKGMPSFTENTITTKNGLLQALDEARRLGYAFDNEECEKGARCVAAPIRNYTGKIVAGASVSGPTTRMTDSHINSHLPFLLDAARQISLRLGWKGDEEPAPRPCDSGSGQTDQALL